MSKYIIFFFLIISSQLLFGQMENIELDKNSICDQIDLVKNYIKSDKEIRLSSIRLDTLIRDGWGYDYFSVEYISIKLKVPAKELWDQDKKTVGRLFKSLENQPYLSGISPDLDCIKPKNKPNLILSKIDDESMVANITTSRLGKEGSSGWVLLFFFEGSKIRKVSKVSWIE